jgi:hypothetical protein
MKYPLDGPVPPQEELEEIDGAEVIEIMEDAITAKIELMPEMAHRIEEANKQGRVQALGAFIDAALLYDIDSAIVGQILTKANELLALRKHTY